MRERTSSPPWPAGRKPRHNADELPPHDAEAERALLGAVLAQLSGFSERTVRSRVKDMERIGIIEVTTPPLKAPSLYRLLPFGNDCRTSGNGCRAFGSGEGQSVAGIRRNKESKTGKPEKPQKNGKPLGTAERISLEKRLQRLRREEQELAHDLSDLVQRECQPDKVARLAEVRQSVEEVERQLAP